MPRIRALLFDVGDTLWHAPSPPTAAEFRAMAAARSRAFLGARGYEGGDSDLYARAAWDSLIDAMARAEASTRVEPDYTAEARAALARAGLDLEREETAAFLDAIYISGAEGGKRAFPEAPGVLRELKRRGYLLATVTNRAFGGERFRRELREADLDPGWDAHAISVEVGYLKPHAALFEHALNALSVQAAEALMVGNSLLEDVAGAARLGIHTAWRRSPPDAEGIEPDVTVGSLDELLALPCLVGVS
jgi:putative hydrolase of the HAD superfamily